MANKRIAAGLERWQVDEECSPSKKPTGLCYRWEEGACLPTVDQFVSLLRLCGDRREYEDLRREYEDLRRPFFASPERPYTDVWDFPTVSAYAGKHPCEKPLAMMEHIIETSSRPGALVLDCFAGSGVVGEAARNYGRRALLCEIEPKWCRAIAQRLSQGNLFAEPVAPVREAMGTGLLAGLA